MQKYLPLVLLILAIFSLENVVSRKHECMHDNHMQDYEISIAETNLSESERRRALTISSPEPIRITYDISKLYDLPSQRQKLIPYLEKQIQLAAKFLSDTLQVQRETTNIYARAYQDKCLDMDIPTKDRDQGIKNSDLHIYVIWKEEQASYLANAGACVLNGTTNRPIFGRVLFNTYHLATVDIDDPQQFEDDLETTIHEITHILGFSGGMIKYWKNPETGQAYDEPTIPFRLRNRDTTLLKTPKVLEYARQYYGCNSLQGMELENQGGSGSLGSHWERITLQNEFMTAQAVSLDASYSIFTFKLLEDTGFYKPVYENLDEMNWGKGKGCGFIQNTCDFNAYQEFADPDVSISCDFHNNAMGPPTYDTFSDGCYYFTGYSNRHCFNKSDIESALNPTIYGTYGGHGSKCFKSTVFHRHYSTSNDSYLRCHEPVCDENNNISIKIAGELYACDKNSNTCTISTKGNNANLEGTVTLPYRDWSVFCNEELTPCKNFCSKKGYCMKNKCHCLPGYLGDDCSVTCDGYFHNDECVSQCPVGYEPEQSTKNCVRSALDCDIQCNGCTGTTSNCNSCNGGITRTAAPSCSCAPGYYENNEADCEQCVYPCQNCTSANACTSCATSAGRKDTTSCQCGVGYYDNGSNCQQCQSPCSTCDASGCLSCPQGTDCPCQDGYYQGSGDSECKKCNSPCKTCSSPTICLTCQPGYYRFGTECRLCDSKCETCSDEDTCLTCSSSAGRNSQLPCGCKPGFYELEGQADCQECQAPCSTCSGSYNQCLSCVSRENSVGLPSCGCTEGYYSANFDTECLPCEAGCLRCTNSYTCIESSFCENVDYDLDFTDINTLTVRFSAPLKLSAASTVSINSTYSKTNCSKVFQTATINKFGQQPTCNVSKDGNGYITVTVKLSYTTTFDPSEAFQFVSGQFQRLDCSSAVIENYQKGENLYVTRDFSSQAPTTTIDGKSSYQPCETISLTLGAIQNDAKRTISSFNWRISSTTSTTTNINTINTQLSQNSSKQFTLDTTVFNDSQTITVTVSFINFFGVIGSVSKTIKIYSAQSIDLVLQNTGSDLIFNIYEENSLTMSMQQSSCDSNVDAKQFTYELLQTNSDYVPYSNSQAITSGQTTNIQSNLSLKVPKFSGQPENNYYLQLRAYYTQSQVYTLNIKYYFRSSDLSVYIDGGDRTVSSANVLTLKGTYLDRDLAQNQSSGISAQWVCTDLETSSSCMLGDEFLVLQQQTGTQTLDLSALTESKTWKFTLIGTKGDRTSQNSVEIQINYSSTSYVQPDINVSISDFVYERKVSQNENIQISVAQGNGSNYDLRFATYTLTLSYNGQQVATKQYSFQQFQFTLADLYSNFTSDQDDATLTLTVSHSDFKENYVSNFPIQIDFAPVATELTVSPASGQSLTKFTLDVPDVNDADYPITYQYRLFTSQEDFDADQNQSVSLKSYLLSLPSTTSSITTYLPRPKSGNYVIVEAVITDASGTVQKVSKNVNITAQQNSAIPAIVTNLVDSPLSFYEQIRALTIFALDFIYSGAGNSGDSSLKQAEHKVGSQLKEYLLKTQDIGLQIQLQKIYSDMLSNSQSFIWLSLDQDTRDYYQKYIDWYPNYELYFEATFTKNGNYYQFSTSASFRLRATDSLISNSAKEYKRLRNLQEQNSEEEEEANYLKDLLKNTEQLVQNFKGTYFASNALPNEKKFQYSGENFSCTFQRQSYDSANDLLENQNGLEQFLDEQQQQVQIFQNINIFDKTFGQNSSQQSQQVYNTAAAIYKNQPYQYSSTFPEQYKSQEQVVQQVSIAKADDPSQENIQLQKGQAINYKFDQTVSNTGVKDDISKNICVQQDSEGNWQSETCETSIESNQVICRCSLFTQTTVVQDDDGIFNKILKTEELTASLEKSASFYIMIVMLIVVAVLSVTGVYLDKVDDIKKLTNLQNTKVVPNNCITVQNQTEVAGQETIMDEQIRSQSRIASNNETMVNEQKSFKHMQENQQVTEIESQQNLAQQQQQQPEQQQLEKQTPEFVKYHHLLSLFFVYRNDMSRLQRIIQYFAGVFVSLVISCQISESMESEGEENQSKDHTLVGLALVLLLSAFGNTIFAATKAISQLRKIIQVTFSVIFSLLILISFILSCFIIKNMTESNANSFAAVAVLGLIIDVLLVQSSVSVGISSVMKLKAKNTVA